MERIKFNDTSKGFYEAMFTINNYLKECGLAYSLGELIKVRASQINGCAYCIDMHHKDALKAGESFERLYLLPTWKEANCYSDEEKAVLNFTEALTKISESEVEEAYEEMATYFSKHEIANIVLAICQINAWNRIAITFGNIPGSYKA